MKKKTNIFIVLTIIFIYIFTLEPIYSVGFDVDNEDALEKFIQSVYDEKNRGIMAGEWRGLKKYFDLTKKYAQWSYEHEAKRIKYLWDWSRNRGTRFTDIKSEIALKKVIKKDGMYLLSIRETSRFNYKYEDDSKNEINSFEVSLGHSIGLVNKDGKWLITRDWYADCFEDALVPYSGIHIGILNRATSHTGAEKAETLSSLAWQGKYDRKKAIEYADKYYTKYNSKYRDYNGIGGDCTNYVSQCLSDKEEGGGLKFDGSWFCSYPKYGKPEGSRAFVNADAFRAYLVYSGRGRVIKRGTFDEVAKPTEDNPIGAVGYLQLGDLICFEKKGGIEHFSIITAKDSKGYPMINSHTVDRFHVPFDLGWGSKTARFHLIKICR